jgi:hypothetical protein
VWFHLLTGKSHKSSNKRSLMKEAGVRREISEIIERCTGVQDQRPDAASLARDLERLEHRETPPSLHRKNDIEIAILAMLGEDDHQREPGEGSPVANVINSVGLIEPSGYRRNGALRRLMAEGLVTETVESWNHSSSRVITLSDSGWAWLDANDEVTAPIAMRLRDATARTSLAADTRGSYGVADDDIPF